MKQKLLTGIDWFIAFSIGSLVTSITFYWAYDKYLPMVWSAAVVSGIHIIKNFARIMDETL